MSSTTLGDDDVSVDTLNTADTPTTVGSRSSRPRDQRSRGSAVKDSPAAAAAAAGLLSGKEVYTTPGSRRVTSSARGSAGAGTEAGATPAEGKMSPLMPTPPPTDGDVVAQAVCFASLHSLCGSLCDLRASSFGRALRLKSCRFSPRRSLRHQPLTPVGPTRPTLTRQSSQLPPPAPQHGQTLPVIFRDLNPPPLPPPSLSADRSLLPPTSCAPAAA